MSRYVLELSLPGLPVMRSNARWHWRARHRHDRGWQTLVVCAVGRQAPPVPLVRARVEIIRRTTAARIDPDGCAASCKPLLDGLVHARVLADDSADEITLVSRSSRVRTRAEQGVWIRVTEIPGVC